MTNGECFGNILERLGAQGNISRKNLQKQEKSSWQSELIVIEWTSSPPKRVRAKMYLVNWITQRRTSNTLDNLNGYCLSVLERKTANENSWVKFARTNLFKKHDFRASALRYNFLRVWSWLRTNAGGVPNTCKSNENRRIETSVDWSWGKWRTGE